MAKVKATVSTVRATLEVNGMQFAAIVDGKIDVLVTGEIDVVIALDRDRKPVGIDGVGDIRAIVEGVQDGKKVRLLKPVQDLAISKMCGPVICQDKRINHLAILWHLARYIHGWKHDGLVNQW